MAYRLQTPLRALTQLFRLFPLTAPHGGVPDTAHLKHTLSPCTLRESCCNCLKSTIARIRTTPPLLPRIQSENDTTFTTYQAHAVVLGASINFGRLTALTERAYHFEAIHRSYSRNLEPVASRQHSAEDF